MRAPCSSPSICNSQVVRAVVPLLLRSISAASSGLPEAASANRSSRSYKWSYGGWVAESPVVSNKQEDPRNTQIGPVSYADPPNGEEQRVEADLLTRGIRDNPLRKSWDPYKFVLEGWFCPLQDIAPQIDRAREEAGASGLLLLATDDSAFLRSLTLFAPASNRCGRELTQVLQASNSDEMPELPELVRRAAFQPSVATTDRLIESLALLARLKGRSRLEKWLKRPNRWSIAPTGDLCGRGRIAPVLLLQDATDRSESPESIDPARTVEITAMVNSTVQADVRRDTAIMASLDDTLKRPPPKDGSIDLAFDRVVEALVRLSLQVSSSDAAAYYVPGHSGSRLALISQAHASQEKEGGGEAAVEFPSSLDAGARSLVAACMREHRTIQLPPGLGRRPEVRLTPRRSAGCIELVTPVTGPLGSPRGRPVGVLSVVKSDPDRQAGYGSYDLALLRNISLRLALFNAASKTELTARTFARGGMRSRARDSQSVAALADSETDSGKLLTLPDDIEEALPAITGGLRRIAEATGSHSATFRAALPYWRSEEVHGLALMRVAAHPAERLEDPHRILTQAEKGITWQVAITGQPKHAGVVEDDSAYRRVRTGTASELSLPVYVEGRLIGVVNLESASLRCYEEFAPLGWLFAEHVAGEITNARLAMTQRIQEHAHELVGTAHEIAADCDDLKQLGGRLSPETETELRRKADGIEMKARTIGQIFLRRRRRARMSNLPTLLNQAIDESSISFITPEIAPYRPWRPHPPKHGQLIRAALRDVLVNVKQHSPLNQTERGLTLRHVEWGGYTHEVVIVSNIPDRYLGRKEAINLYRIPVVHRVELMDGSGVPAQVELPHLGAYLAGARMRLIGGDVYLSASGDGKQVRVTMIVPEWLGND